MVEIKINHARPSAVQSEAQSSSKRLPAQKIIADWMAKSSETLARHDVSAHMALISKDVKVHGVPELNVIGYQDWFASVSHEFSNKLVKSVEFKGDQIRAQSDTDIMLITLEVLTAVDGHVVENGLEVLLRLEEDGQWRVFQERILKEDEKQHYGLVAN